MSSLLLATQLAMATEIPAALPRATPESQGLSSSGISRLVERLDREIDHLHSLMLLRNGHVVAEGWWAPYAADRPHMMYSLSKSWTSTAIGLLVAEGRISIHDPVTQFFPEAVPADASDNLRAMRVRDLLAMSTGQRAEEVDKLAFTRVETTPETFFRLAVDHKPGTLFVYNTPATYMLSAILQRVTGQTLTEYLTPRLYEPLGIGVPEWLRDSRGVDLGGVGLNLRTEDVAKFGQLYLQRGEWQGRRLLPAEWVDLATSKQASNGSDPESEWDQGYGFQFWRCRHGAYRGDGAFGQYCIVMPDERTVIAITGGVTDMGAVMDVLWQELRPNLRAAALREDANAHAALGRQLAGLVMPLPVGDAVPNGDWLGKAFRLESNLGGWETIRVTETAIEAEISGLRHTWPIQNAGWTDAGIVVGEASSVAAAWANDHTLRITRIRHLTPYSQYVTVEFGEGTVVVTAKDNVGFIPSEFRAVGR
ncbi:MAG: serine hydrolase [Fimbriimonadaceae bacterium]|nr:serine hydrolase [Fimbriimonadaceae bacterium]